MSRRSRPPNSQPYVKLFQTLTYRFSPWEVWKDFIVMCACALANPFDKARYQEREKLYLEIIGKYDKKEQILFPQLMAEVVNALASYLWILDLETMQPVNFLRHTTFASAWQK